MRPFKKYVPLIVLGTTAFVIMGIGLYVANNQEETTKPGCDISDVRQQ